MEKRRVLALLCALTAAADLAGCAGRSANYSAASSAAQTDPASTIPNRACNPALVVNPVFLGTNEGLAGAGGPDLPGAGGATGPNCRRN